MRNAFVASWFFCVCSASALASNDTVYKSVDANGRVIYSQSPGQAGPVNGANSKVMEFKNLPASPLSAETLKFRAEIEKSIAAKAAAGFAPPAHSGTLLYSAAWCGYCKLAKAYLQQSGHAYQEIDIDKPEGMRSFVQVQPKSGIPVLLKDGKRLNGFSQQAYDYFFKANR